MLNNWFTNTWPGYLRKMPRNSAQNTITAGQAGVVLLTLVATLGTPALLVENTEQERLFEVSGGGAIGAGTGANAFGALDECLKSGGGSGSIMSWGTCGAGGSGTGVSVIQENDVTITNSAETLDFLGSDFNLSESPTDEVNISIEDSGIDHDATTNFVANEHIDWTAATQDLNTSGTVTATGARVNLSFTGTNLYSTSAANCTVVDTNGSGLIKCSTVLFLTGGSIFAGDVTGTYQATVVGDDSHAHTTTTLSSIDISDDTNLAVTAPVVLTDDTLSLTVAKDIVAGVGLSGGEDNVLPGADADTTLTFDATEIDAVTWSDNANASNAWTFDVSGTDHTMTAGSGDMRFSHNVSIADTGSGDHIHAERLLTTSGALTAEGAVTLANLDCSGNANGGSLTADANGLVSCTDDDSGGAGGSPGGSNTQVQFNSNSSFAGDAGMTYNSGSNTLNISNTSGGLIFYQTQFSGSGSIDLEIGGTENIRIDASDPRQITNGLINIDITAGLDGVRALTIDMNANGFSDIHAIAADFEAMSMEAGDVTAPFLANIDRSDSTGGRVTGFRTQATGTGTADVAGMFVTSEVDPIIQQSGTLGAIESAFTHDGSFTDVTASFNSTSSDATMFATDNDYVYVGDAEKFTELSFNFETVSSKNIEAIFEFSAGSSTWTAFNPTDATNGMQGNGSITWATNVIPTWATDTVNSVANKYWIRIQRTRNGAMTAPVEDLVEISAGTTQFSWDKDGDIIVNNVDASGDLSSSGSAILDGNVTLNNDDDTSDSSITFSTSKTFTWVDALDLFELNDSLTLVSGTLTATGVVVDGTFDGSSASTFNLPSDAVDAAGEIANAIITATKLANADFGDFSCDGAGSCTLDADTVSTSEIATGGVDTAEILDGAIIEPDLNADNSPSDADILTYDSTGTNFAWVSQLPLANGGTNANLTAANGGIVYSTASALAITAAGSQDQVVRSNGAAAPTWGTLTLTGSFAPAYESSVSMVTREGFYRVVSPHEGTFTGFEARVTTAPTGTAMQFDVRECNADCSTSCTSIFSTNPEVDVSATEDDNNHVFSDTTLEEDNCYLFDIDQIGSTIGGSGASLKLEYSHNPFF